MSTEFFLGTHMVGWMTQTNVPLFISRRRLMRRKSPWPKSTCEWALDSGGFTELRMFGKWSISEEEYVDEVRKYASDIGGMRWAAQMDWMVEPLVRNGGAGKDPAVGTGLSIEQHQVKTVANYVRLCELAPEIQWAPVLQGWEPVDYFNHLEMFRGFGVRLTSLPIVGVGSVCRRQGTDEIQCLLRDLHAEGLKLHGFGVKKAGLEKSSEYLESADSMAWSYCARRAPDQVGHEECRETHANCANCIYYALLWRHHLVGGLECAS